MYRILLADDEGIMLESLKKIIELNMEMNVRSLCKVRQSCGGDGTGIFAGYLFYGYPDAGDERLPGDPGHPGASYPPIPISFPSLP